MRRILPTVWAGLMAILTVSVVASAQTQTTKVKRVPVSVVLTSAFPYAGDVVILRRPETVPSDLIVMRSDKATAEIFSEAIHDLIDIRRIGGDLPETNALLRSRPTDSKTRRKLLPWSERVLADVRAKPVETFGGFTNAQVVQIWLPRTHKDK
jgi:hypothetical protein